MFRNGDDEGRLTVDRGRGSPARCPVGIAVSSLDTWERRDEFDDEEGTEPAAGGCKRWELTPLAEGFCELCSAEGLSGLGV